MKFSERWLREWADPDIDSDALCEKLTMAGLEVEGIEAVRLNLNNIVAARIVAISPHPDVERLQLCEVDFGAEQTAAVLSGATNLRPGMVTGLARAGLPDEAGTRDAELAGVLPDGALCSEKTLGLTENTDEIIELDPSFTVGRPLNEFLTPADNIIEISITPNRGDCFSIKGVAREVAILSGCPLHEAGIDSATIAGDSLRRVDLEASQACPKYLGRLISGVDCGKKSPFWLREKLCRSGIRPLTAVVDITNYIMLELGQPLHAFDNDKLAGDIRVRYSQGGENLILLDESKCELSPETLVIADENRPVALAGIMGGLDSAVAADTQNIFLECAYFAPEAIAGRARQYKLQTDSSQRFERGVDSELQADAMEMATALIIAICGGKAGAVFEAKDEDHIPQPSAIHLRSAQIARVLGVELPEAQIQTILDKLHMPNHRIEDGWMITPPSHRFDLQIEVDVIEELARIQGYENIPHAAPAARLVIRPDNKIRNRLAAARSVLTQRGYQEAVTFSFVDPGIQNLLTPEIEAMELTNPIAPEISHMRTSLWPGLLGAVRYNIKRQQERVRLFEIGLVFKNARHLSQEYHVGGVSIGNYYENQWNIPYNSCNLYDIKADIQSWLNTLGLEMRIHYSEIEHSALQPGQAAGVYCGETRIGWFGRLHPRIGAALALPGDCYLFECNAEKIADKIPSAIRKLSKFPAVKRDLSFEIGEDVPVAEVIHCVKNQLEEDLYNLELFDVYQGEGIDPGKKSLALGLTFQKTSRTLTDEEVESLMNRVLNQLGKQFGAKQRESKTWQH